MKEKYKYHEHADCEVKKMHIPISCLYLKLGGRQDMRRTDNQKGI